MSKKRCHGVRENDKTLANYKSKLKVNDWEDRVLQGPCLMAT